MNSKDDFHEFLDEIRGKQARERESGGQPSRVKGFFKRNSRRFSVAGIVTVVFSALALTPGIGYNANVNIVSTQLLVKGHPCHGYVSNGTMRTYFNRFCYPANHMFGSEVSTTFTWISGPYDSSAESVKEGLVIDALLSEFPINVPLFFVTGYIIALVFDKSVQKIRSPKK